MLEHAQSHPRLARLLRRVLGLLERTEPESEKGDRVWRGPHFIPRRGEWWPSRFVLYRDELHCTLEIGWSSCALAWNVGTDGVSFDARASFGSGFDSGPELWLRALPQIERRLRAAIARPAAYNRRVERLLPLRCRTGRIERKWTWPAEARQPLSPAGLGRLNRALGAAARTRAWRRLSLRRYLEVAGSAYDAAFRKLARLTPLEKYRGKADTRHGGLLEVPPDDADAFERWYQSRDWLGAHPWEIVFAHPHGILLSPHRAERGWRFHLGVDTLGLYVATARMATALGERGVPFELVRAAEVIAALSGEDRVEIGPFYDQLSLDELKERRPEAVARVQWDPPPGIALRAHARRSRGSGRSATGPRSPRSSSAGAA